MSASFGMMSNKFSELEQSVEGLKLQVGSGDLLTSINVAAGKAIFQVKDGKATGTLMITPQTVYIQDATIKSSQIESLSADKLTAGTIDAKVIKVINLDANAISTGVLGGRKGSWNLTTGHFRNGLTADQYNSDIDDISDFYSVELRNGVLTGRQYGYKLITMNGPSITFWKSWMGSIYANPFPKSTAMADSTMEQFAGIQNTWWMPNDIRDKDGNLQNFCIWHTKDGPMSIAYSDRPRNADEPPKPDEINPYIVFDYNRLLKKSDLPITVYEGVQFCKLSAFLGPAFFSPSLVTIAPVACEYYSDSLKANGIFIGLWKGWGLMINGDGLFWLSGRAAWGGSGYSGSETRDAVTKLNLDGEKYFKSGVYRIEDLTKSLF